MALVEDLEGSFERLGLCLNDKKLSDVVVETEDGREFFCHKVILAAISPVFAAMFDSHVESGEQSFREGEKGVVVIKELDPTAVEWVLSAMHTGKGVLTEAIVVPVMMTASMYQVDWVTTACKLFLRDSLKEDTCCAIFDQLVGVTNRGLQGLYAQFIHDNMAKISDKESFLELSADAIQHLAMYRTTFDFCVALARWLDHDVDSRQEIGGPLLIDLDFFSLNVDELEIFAGLKAIECFDTLQRDLKHVIRAQTASETVEKGTFFTSSSSVHECQDWKVPRSGWYHIVAMGAKAADAANYQGGRGAMIGASFELRAGQIVKILTGSMSRVENNLRGDFSRGGGGTFVVGPDGSLLIAAGGGGGCSEEGAQHGCDADLRTREYDLSQHLRRTQGNKPRPSWMIRIERSPNQEGDVLECGGGGVYSGGEAYADACGGSSYVCCEATNVWKKVGSKGDGRVSIWNCKGQPFVEAFQKWLDL